jgi:hypothetical protein
MWKLVVALIATQAIVSIGVFFSIKNYELWFIIMH